MNATTDQLIEDHLAILGQASGVMSGIMVRLPGSPRCCGSAARNPRPRPVPNAAPGRAERRGALRCGRVCTLTWTRHRGEAIGPDGYRLWFNRDELRAGARCLP